MNIPSFGQTHLWIMSIFSYTPYRIGQTLTKFVSPFFSITIFLSSYTYYYPEIIAIFPYMFFFCPILLICLSAPGKYLGTQNNTCMFECCCSGKCENTFCSAICTSWRRQQREAYLDRQWNELLGDYSLIICKRKPIFG